MQLTPLEFSLWYLCERQGVVVPSEELFEAVWGEKYLKNNNTVMAHIGRLREKLDEPARSPRFIKTVWGWLHHQHTIAAQAVLFIFSWRVADSPNGCGKTNSVAPAAVGNCAAYHDHIF